MVEELEATEAERDASALQQRGGWRRVDRLVQQGRVEEGGPAGSAGEGGGGWTGWFSREGWRRVDWLVQQGRLEEGGSGLGRVGREEYGGGKR